MSGEPLPQGQPRLRVMLFFQQLEPAFLPVEIALDQPQTQLSLSQRTADAQQVSRLGARPQDCFALANFAQNGEAGHDQRVLRRIASRQDQTEPPGGERQAVEEAVKPGSSAGVRKPQGQEELPRSSAHGGDVARSSRQGLVADSLRRMNLS